MMVRRARHVVAIFETYGHGDVLDQKDPMKAQAS
jgi:hypothetical protein